jgi:hypothetical protein
MSFLPDPEKKIVAPGDYDENCIVVAGPGSSSTIPGIIVSEIVMAFAASSRVRRIEVDLGAYSTMGLHRAPSLAAAHDVALRFSPQRHRAPRDAQARKKALRQWIGPDVNVAIAYAWPGIDNDWIRDFLQVAKAAGVRTIVLCASLPSSHETRAVSLVGTMRGADRVVVGDATEASELVAAFGAYGPEVQTHRALSLIGRPRRSSPQQFTAFLPSDSIETLAALMVAFDAIPDSQVNNYGLRVMTRYQGSAAKCIVAKSYHARHVRLFGDDMTKDELRELCDTSSAISMADPQLDSRAYSAAVDCGIATVVLATSRSAPTVGRGYVGGLMADGCRPASIHVAMAHALRLDELGFPSPAVWRELAERNIVSSELAPHPVQLADPSLLQASAFVNG